MPVQKSQSGFLAKLSGKLQAAHERHKMDDVQQSAFTTLPSGIKGGVARLVEIKFDQVKEGKQNAGEYYFYAAGVVVSPETFTDKDGKTHQIAGKRTSIIEPLYDTPTRARKTFDDHWAQVLQELKKLGVATEEFEYDQVESVCAALKGQEIYFGFRTWGGEPRPDPQTKQMREGIVNETWEGLVAFDVDADPTGAVDEDVSSPPSRPVAKAPSKPVQPPAASKPVTTPPPARKPASVAPAAPGKSVKPGVKTPPPPPAPEPEEFNEFGDLDSLAELADGGDEDAQAQLTELATTAGISEDDISGAADWAALVVLIKGDQPPAEASNEPDAFAVGNVYKYRPINPKTKQPDKRMADVEVMAIHDDGTADVQNVATKVLYKKVPVGALEQPTV